MTKPSDAEIGMRLKQAREAKGLTIDQAARKAGIKPKQWAAWEAGGEIPFTAGYRASLTLGVDATWLAYGEGDSPRGGYTLTELLVVIAIIVILLAATLPLAKRVMDDSQANYSARLLAGQFTMAKTLAARNSRPAGVWLEIEQPNGLDPSLRMCRTAYLAEVPLPYSGDTMNAFAAVAIDSTNPSQLTLSFPGGGASMLPTLLSDNPTFLIRFDHNGVWYAARMTGSGFNLVVPLGGPDGQWGIAGYDDDGDGLSDNLNIDSNGDGSPDRSGEWGKGDDLSPVPHTGPGVPFTILRRPARAGSPLELVAGTCVDLSYSGFAQTQRVNTNFNPTALSGGLEFAQQSNRIIVMFKPDGSLDSVHLNNAIISGPQSLHLLVGQIDKLNVPLGGSQHPSGLNYFDSAKSNLADVNSIWMNVSRNGKTTTSENLPPASYSDWTTIGQAAYLFTCRAAGRE